MELKEILNKLTKKDLIEQMLAIAKENNIDLSTYFVDNGEISTEVQEVFNYFNSKKIKTERQITDKTSKLIKKAIKLYTLGGLKLLIDRYNCVVKDPYYYFNYKWNITEFLSRKEGISSFTDEGSKWQNYKSKRPTVNTSVFFDRIWGIYPNKSGIENARIEFDKKFIGKDLEQARHKANEIYIKLTDYIEETDEEFIKNFANWLRGEISNQ